MGNCKSILNMIKYASDGKVTSIISRDPKLISKASGIIIPGVGSFDHGISNLRNLNLVETLEDSILNNKTKVLGICLGMQLMTNCSEEGKLNGLGWVDAETVKFRLNNTYKVPHIGWNYISALKNKSLFLDIDDLYKFYFVHSYYIKCNIEEDIASKTWYGHEFTSSFEKNNIYGVQFHPEKSHKYGMKVIKNFLEI
jgi:glutamine amidotransferase